MTKEIQTIADRDTSSLTVSEQNSLMKVILEELVHSAALDDQANDVLEVFDDYDWRCRDDADQAAFQCLREKGNDGTMSYAELDQFLDLVSASGPVHLYFWIRKARHVLSE
ncbi:MAG: hypothetical protein OEY58_19420 [Gammaproteobacteria bacterium]|nr:hypothetical protein [Gammaproteobacteria bacterium]